MKIWLTTRELAELALPGFPATRQGWDLKIRADGWPLQPQLARSRAGREGGGGLEYHIDNLPLSARIALAARHFRVEPEDLRPPESEGDTLSARARTVRDARLVLLALADRFRREQQLSTAAADDLFCALFNARSIALPAWITRTVTSASARTLARWRARRAEGSTLGHDAAAARRGTGKLEVAADGQVKVFVLAAIAKMPFLSAKDIREAVADKFGGDFNPPPLRTFQQVLKVWRADYRNELMLLTDPDGYRSKVEYSATGVIRAERLNQIWMIDASPADVMLKQGRHSIYLTVDVAARRVKVLATPTPRAAAVGLMMRKCLIAWGVPETVLTDNGSDFVASATQRLIGALGIEAERSQRYDPKSRGKGLVERPIGTFQRDLACLPGFVGHSVADRKRLEGRKAFAQRLGSDEKELFGVDMDLGEFQAWCDTWSDTIYASTPHEGLGGLTPIAAAAKIPGTVRHIGDLAALDILLAPAPGKDGLRTVTKTGVRIGGAHYLPDAVMPGTSVFCRMDPADLGRVLLFEPDGETYLGTAICAELAGLDPVETIARVKAAQKAHVEGRLKDIRREMRRIGPRQIADARRREGEKRAGKLLAFPRATLNHSTPALAAAGDAAAAPRPAALSGAAARLHAQMQDEIQGSGQQCGASSGVTRLPETREQRFRRACEIEERLAGGGTAPAADLIWLGGYRQGSEYRAMRSLADDFGVEAIGGTKRPRAAGEEET